MLKRHRYPKPKRGKWGYWQGRGWRSGETTEHLIWYKGELVTETSANTIMRTEAAVIKRNEVDEDKDFLDRALNL